MIEIPHPIAAAAGIRPDHPLVEIQGRTITAAQLAKTVAAQAGTLAERGITAGERVALIGVPSADWISALWAITWLGAVPVPIAARVPADERDRLLRAANTRHSVSASIDEGTPIPPASWTLEDPRLVMLSSGTSATAQPISLTTAQIAFSAFGSALRLGHDPADRWLCCLPLHHVGGLSILLRCAMYGTTAVIHPRFSAAGVAKALQSDRISLVSLVPAMLEALLDEWGDRALPTTLRAVLVGGAATPETLLERCRAAGVPVSLTWGMTETASQVATRFPGDLSPDAGCGPPLAFTTVQTTDNGLHVSGPIAPSGKLSTSDQGRIDAAGRVHVSGRTDDAIISGGENIAPDEVEAVLAAHPAVAQAGVIGEANARWGERPIGYIVQNAGAARPSHTELDRWCRERLASFKVPDALYWCTGLPRTDLGKLSRARLRQRQPSAFERVE